jgi:TfoX/Sxy family transcriptional regulator of competence genes
MTVALAMDRARELADQIDSIPSVTVSRFFAGAALRADRVQFGFVMKGILYLRVDDRTRADFEARDAEPFRYAGAKENVKVASYYEAPTEVLEDPQHLSRWAARALRAALAASDRKRSPKRTGRAGART